MTSKRRATGASTALALTLPYRSSTMPTSLLSRTVSLTASRAGEASAWPLALWSWWLDIQYADKVRMKLSVLLRRERPHGRSGNNMRKIVRKTLAEAKVALAGQQD